MVRAALLALVACAHAPATIPSVGDAPDDITLYRDLAFVRRRVTIDMPAATSTVTVTVPFGVLVLTDPGELVIRGIHMRDGGDHAIALDLTAPRPGRYAITLGFFTDRLKWDAAYTMTTTPARDVAVLHGAIAVRNTTGVGFARAAIHVIDANLSTADDRAIERVAAQVIGSVPSTTPSAPPSDLGIATLGTGETRVSITGIEAPRAMRSVLVYDPIGTTLDNPSGVPEREDALGVEPAAPMRITESFEVARGEIVNAGLPAGPVRLLERRPDGSLAVLGESRLFDAATRVADVDTIAVGTADGVTGHRERRDLTIDDERRRLVEEFSITLDNVRPRAVDVLVREHLYRGQTWTLAYASTDRTAKEGAQQIALRTRVPANATAQITYVVVYTWDP